MGSVATINQCEMRGVMSISSTQRRPPEWAMSGVRMHRNTMMPLRHSARKPWIGGSSDGDQEPFKHTVNDILAPNLSASILNNGIIQLERTGGC
jgi:hypothetical protein